jgi:sugar-specific transcriptional regulator TrmB
MNIGLTSYEARCYVSLAALGPAEPRKVADDADVPYSSVYRTLDSLASKGWVDLVVKKPATYRAKKPESIKATVESKLEDTFDVLERVYSTEPTDEAELVYTLRGRDNVLAKIYELVRAARQSIVFVAPMVSLDDRRLLELLNQSLARGIGLRMIADEGALGLLPSKAEIRRGNLVAVDLMVDDKAALISLPDYSACGWVDSPTVAGHFKQFLELMWNAASTTTR